MIALHIYHYKTEIKYIYLPHLSTFIQFADHFYLFGVLDICPYCERSLGMEHGFSEEDRRPLSNIG